MENKWLVVNPGSQSKKYGLCCCDKEITYFHFEKEDNNFLFTIIFNSQTEKEIISKKIYDRSINYLFKKIISKEIIKSIDEISAVGLRIVAPGNFFTQNRVLNKEFMIKLKETEDLAPLHINPILTEINSLQKILPNIPIFGISDSSYHTTIPKHLRFYSIPIKDSLEFNIFRYGYHGISIKSIMRKIYSALGNIPKRIIICHLGGGASITAIRDGKSLDTSMGFTPLEGLTMGTRTGDIDPGAVIFLAKKKKLNLNQLENYLNYHCGLLGLSGKSSDVRILLSLEENGDKDAKLALDVFISKIKKYIGAYSIMLKGLDLLIFSGAVGEKFPIIRSRICQDLELLGIHLNKNENDKTIGKDNFIHSKSSQVNIAVIITDEIKEIARETKKLFQKYINN